MSSVSSTSNTNSSSAAGSSSSSSSNTIAGNFDQFLTLLTTQLQNQDPTDPLDTNQFTQQLVEFAGVEQQLQTNDTLTQLLAATKSTNIANGVNFIGATVTVDGSTSTMNNGSAAWQVTAPRAAASSTITIKDSNGNVVQSYKQPLNAGAQTLTWNGSTATGTVLTSGSYTISIDATDASGQPVTVSTDATGVVTSVDLTGATPVLTVGGMTYNSTQVKSITRNS